MKLLVVEDEHRIATYVKKGLEMKSYVVDVAYDGDTGLDLALSEEYEVIILDRMLPQLDGVEFIKQLRAEKKHTPILMLTAKSGLDDKVSGLDAGADDYLTKPFAFSELLARIRALSRRPTTTTATKLVIADLEIDPASYTVRRQDQIIELSKKELALLEFLARHKGQLFTKDQLTEHVWNYDSDVLANTAQVYIGYLRKKIDKPFSSSPPLIHTIHGFGYKLDIL